MESVMGSNSRGDEYYGYSRKDVVHGLKWLKGFGSRDIQDMLAELYKEHFNFDGRLCLVMDPVALRYYNTPDVADVEYYGERGVMSPRCFVELRDGGWVQDMLPEEMEWEIVDDPYDGEYCILKSDYGKGRVDKWRLIDNVWDDLWDSDKDERRAIYGEYLFFNVLSILRSDFDWVSFLGGGYEEKRYGGGDREMDRGI